MTTYYVVIDKGNKTLELVKSESCLATTVDKWQKQKGWSMK